MCRIVYFITAMDALVLTLMLLLVELGGKFNDFICFWVRFISNIT